MVFSNIKILHLEYTKGIIVDSKVEALFINTIDNSDDDVNIDLRNVSNLKILDINLSQYSSILNLLINDISDVKNIHIKYNYPISAISENDVLFFIDKNEDRWLMVEESGKKKKKNVFKKVE